MRGIIWQRLRCCLAANPFDHPSLLSPPPRASTESSLTEQVNKNGARLWSWCWGQMGRSSVLMRQPLDPGAGWRRASFCDRKGGVIARSPDRSRVQGRARTASVSDQHPTFVHPEYSRVPGDWTYVKGRHESTVHLALAESPLAHALADRLRREPAHVRPCEIP